MDKIHIGIDQNRKIRFHYFDFTVEKERHLRKDGAYYEVSPFALTWDDENYYLVSFDSQVQQIKHFRVDKMLDIEVTGELRDGIEVYRQLDMGMYARKVFGMFSGEETMVRLRFDRSMVSAVLDRLGQDVMLIPDGEAYFTVRTEVVVSPQFFAWICGFGDLVKVLGPESVVSQFRAYLTQIQTLYQSEIESKT